MIFHEVRCPVIISLGAIGGPIRKSEIIQMENGSEHINSPWEGSIRNFTAETGVKSLDELSYIIGFFEARNGKEIGFRWKDWTDFKSSINSMQISSMDQFLGYGDGMNSIFQLRKTYGYGDGAYSRQISKPAVDTVCVKVDDLELRAHHDFDVDYTTGAIELHDAPGSGVPVYSGFEFDVPVRFDVEQLAITMAYFNAGEIQNIEVKEIRI